MTLLAATITSTTVATISIKEARSAICTGAIASS